MFAAHGQLIKKKVNVPPSPLEKIKINDHFTYQSLDAVYKTLMKNYGVKIVYDSTYCKRRYFAYWFMNTPLPLAIEITTRDLGISSRRLPPMTFSIDSTLTITIKRGAYTVLDPEDDRPIEDIIPQRKYEGLPTKRNYTISGKIVDITSGEPLPFAYVNIRGTSIEANTNVDGYFSLLNVPSDTATITAGFMGYKQVDLFLNPEMESNDLLIELLPVQNSLNEVVITANKDEIMQMSSDNLSMVKLSPAKLAELPNLGEKDIMRAFQLMPGVSAANESSSGLYVRGGTPDQNLVVYDGFTIYHVDHLYGFFSAFNANALKDVQLYKGGFDAKFGGRLST